MKNLAIVLLWTTINVAAWPTPLETEQQPTKTIPVQAFAESLNNGKAAMTPIEVSAGLEITWDYLCPEGGRASKFFSLEAKADFPLTKATVTGTQNIDSIKDLKIKNDKFSGFYVHGSCAQHGSRACVYRFKSPIGGWTERTGLYFDMASLGGSYDETPHVIEDCFNHPDLITPGTCPKVTVPNAKVCQLKGITIKKT